MGKVMRGYCLENGYEVVLPDGNGYDGVWYCLKNGYEVVLP